MPTLGTSPFGRSPPGTSSPPPAARVGVDAGPLTGRDAAARIASCVCSGTSVRECVATESSALYSIQLLYLSYEQLTGTAKLLNSTANMRVWPGQPYPL